jgi:hypothetical protein
MIETLVISALCGCLSFAVANEKYVSVKVKTNIYQSPIDLRNKISSQFIDKGIVLLIKDETIDAYRVTDNGNLSGWVNKECCVAVERSKSFTFDSAEIRSNFDNPDNPIWVDFPESFDNLPIIVSRSFKDEIGNNIDKETAERIVR